MDLTDLRLALGEELRTLERPLQALLKQFDSEHAPADQKNHYAMICTHIGHHARHLVLARQQLFTEEGSNEEKVAACLAALDEAKTIITTEAKQLGLAAELKPFLEVTERCIALCGGQVS